MELEGFIDGMVEMSKTAIQQEESDYLGDDGLLYCGKCHTRKQTEIEILGRTRRPFCLCKCAAEKRDAEEAERKQKEYRATIDKLRKAGFPESDMESWTFENDDMSNKPITEAMKKYVQNFSNFRKAGKGLLLWGETGTGKTYAACEVANALVDEGYPVLVTNFSRIINELQGTFDKKQEYIDGFNRFSLIVIDDLSTERNTEFMNEQVFQIVDARYRAKLPMIITTNLSMREIKDPHDIAKKRIYERILERCHPIKVDGSNRRKAKVKEEYDEMQKMLGLG